MKRHSVSAASLLLAFFGALALATTAIVPASASTVSPQSRGLRIEAHYRYAPELETHVFYTELGDGNVDTYPCMPTNYSYSYPSTPIAIGGSDCGVRVRLYEYINQRGWNVCFSPYQTKSVPAKYQDPNEIYIGTSTAAC